MFAEGLSHTFRSDETPPFEQMVSGLFERSTPEQKGGFVNHLLGVLAPAGFAQALSAAGLGTGPQPVQTGGSLTPHQARQIAPESVQVLARQAVKRS